jgi:tetratricopeptide (TPR) repeat protein
MKPSVLLALTRGVDQLAGALLDHADLDIIVYHDLVLPFMEARGIECRRYVEFLTNEQKLRASGEAEWRVKAVLDGLSTTEMRAHWPETTADDAVWGDFSGAVNHSLSRNVLPEVVMVDTLRRIANETDLRLLVVQQDISWDTRTLVHAGQRLGIPTLHTLHGYPYGATAAIGLFGHGYADVAAVFSDALKETFVALGYPADRLVVTGNFEWDAYCRPPRPGHREKICHNLNLDPTRPIITYALTYTHSFSRISAAHPDYVHRTTDAVLAAFAGLSKRHPDWQFVLRPHPNDADAPQDLDERCRTLGLERMTVDSATAGLCCVIMSDVLLCCQSNLGVEAVLSGKPVVNVVIDAFGQPVFDEGIGRLFRDEDAVVSVRTVAEIGPAVEAALLDPEARRRFREKRPPTIERFNHRNDGKAAERVCKLVLDLVEHGAAFVEPLDRFADLEAALVRAVPDAAARVLVVGRASRWVAEGLGDKSKAHVEAALEVQAAGTGDYDAVVFSDPLPHSPGVDRLLKNARGVLAAHGVLVAAFLSGRAADAQDAFMIGKWVTPRPGFEAPSAMGQYSRLGVEIVLSRTGFVPDELASLERVTLADVLPEGKLAEGTPPGNSNPARVYAWVVRAGARAVGPGAWGAKQDTARARGMRHNERGEALFAEGRHQNAMAAFATAVSEYHEEPLFHSNLATALHALDRYDEAWKQTLTALYYDPSLQSARENLRHIAEALGRTDEADRILGLFGSHPPVGGSNAE